MSGIAGVLSLTKPIDILGLKKMTNIVRHRGPDDEGFYFYGNQKEIFCYGDDSLPEIKERTKVYIDELYNDKFCLAFGHRRLISDDATSKENQPLEYRDAVITYDGTIYNYIEIREKLKREGYYFETEGDTEVILKAYRHWGEKCVNYFNGTWSFVIWDKLKNKLFCSRDRFGEKPFYYFLSDNEFIFSSEIKQILEYGIEPKVNEKILFTFLYYGVNDFSEETFFKNIYSLQSGFNLTIAFDLNGSKFAIKKYKYWDIDSGQSLKFKEFEEEAKILGKELEKSIALRIRSTKKIGGSLSGGLDSSSIITLACEQLKTYFDVSKFKTFTACYDEAKEIDERYYSDLIVENSKCGNIKVKPHVKKLQNDFEKLVWHQDEPFASLSIFASWCVMEEAKKNGVKVLLDGQGGDETLLGYERFYAYSLKEKISKFNIIKFIDELKLSAENSKLTFKMLMFYLFYFNNKTIRKSRLHFKASKFLNRDFISRFKYMNIVDDMFQFKTVEDAQKSELRYSIGHLLRYEDRNSMAHSIETRLPFLDPNFVQGAFKLPTSYKLKDGWTKALLRKYMEGKMPDQVTYRKNKLGYSVPQTKWLNELNDYFRDYLIDDARSSKYFNMQKVREMFEKKINPDLRFKFIVVETWMRVFNVRT